uniref:Uncharacterized protein n=1 Tax=Oryza sativa subsp. japonica TaxID=39947 RepID=Q10QD4_ORYSJ|nr:hypothetical protein LOC_Os03g10380 [Oryza sativa Japonica Group]
MGFKLLSLSRARRQADTNVGYERMQMHVVGLAGTVCIRSQPGTAKRPRRSPFDEECEAAR